MGSGTALHVDMGLLVRLAPLGREALQRSLGIPVPELGTRVATRSPFGKDVNGRVKPDGDRALVQQLARSRVDVGAAARRDDSDLAFDKPRDEPPFSIAKIMLAIALEDLGGREPGGVLDRRVAVDERQAEPPREAAADRRLSYAHQPHQHDRPVKAVAEFYHSRGYTAAHPLGKSARMSRLVVLIIVLLLIVGGLYYLSTVPKAQPTHTIEVPVPQGGNAH